MIDFRSAAHVWERNLTVYRRRWMYALLPNFFEPVFYLLGMGLGLGSYIAAGGTFHQGYLNFIAPGLVAVSAMNGAAFETTYNIFVKLHFARLYDAMVSTRMNMEDVAVGEVMWAMTRSLLYGSIFLLVVSLFGIPIRAGWILVPLAIVLIGFCFASIGMAFTSIIDSIDLFTYFFTMFLTPSFLFSGVFFPVEERFPPFLVEIARVTPLFNAVRLTRGLMQGTYDGIAWNALYLLVLALLLSVFAVRRMRRRIIA